MEYIDGMTLNSLIANNGPLSLDQSLALVRSVCETVRIGHGIQILHRDIKPENLCINQETRHLTVLDYGLCFNAEDALDITRTDEDFRNEFIALPENNTPTGDRQDARSDITSIVGILYYCLTGHKIGQLRDGALRAPHRRPGKEVVSSDTRAKGLTALFDRGVSHDMDSRYQSIDELLKTLEHLESPVVASDLSPKDVFERAAELFSVNDRKTLFADLRTMCQGLRSKMTTYAQQMAKEAERYQFTVSIDSTSSGVPGIESLGGHTPALRISIRHDLHPYRYQATYAYGVKGNRCCLMLWEVGLQKKGENPPASEWREVISFERTDSPDVAAANESIGTVIKAGVNYITRQVHGTSIL
jgi:serine/threonine protein kinase